MSNYKKRGNPFKRGETWTYICYPSDPKTGEKKSKWVGGFETEKEAKAALIQAEAEIQTGVYVKTSNMTVRQLVTRWFEIHKRSLKPNTINGYKNNIDKYILPLLGNKKLCDLDKGVISDFIESLKKIQKPLSPRTIKYIRDVLKMALNEAVDEELIKKNPCLKVAVPKQKRYHAVVYDMAQAKRLLSGAMGSDIEFEIIATLGLGLRRGEVLGLKYADFDFEKGTVYIQRQVTYTNDNTIRDEGKAKTEYGLVDLKTEESSRVLTLPQSVIEAAHRRRKVVLAQKFRAGQAYEDNDLLCTKENGECLSPQTLYHRFKRLLKQLDLPDMRYHDLRHTYATLMLDMDVQLAVISKMLGHTTIAITADIYCEVLDKKKQAAELFEKKVLCN